MASTALAARQHAEAARESAILDAALDLTLELGYDGLTFDELARRAHASKATLYRRWPGKPALVVDALRRDADREPAADLDRGSLRADLVALGAELTDGGERTGRLLLALAAAMQAEPAIAGAVQECLAAPFEARSQAILQRAVDRGELSAGATDLPYARVLLPSLTTTHLLLSPSTPLDIDAIVDQVLLPVLAQSSPAGKARR